MSSNLNSFPGVCGSSVEAAVTNISQEVVIVHVVLKGRKDLIVCFTMVNVRHLSRVCCCCCCGGGGSGCCCCCCCCCDCCNIVSIQ